jgi:RimJ/RimL family protein N-acetyltransferase
MRATDRIYGERIYLRELVRDDVNEMATWPRFSEPDLQWANLDLDDPSDRDLYYERGRSNAIRRRFVVVTYDDRIVGTIGLRNLNFRTGEGTLGIIIRADEVNRGYGSEAIECVLRYAFEELGLRRVVLDVAANNRRALRCYQKAQFAPIGRHRGVGLVSYIDMAITRDEYFRSRGRPIREGAPANRSAYP